MKKYVYLFSEGNKDMRDLLGGKGANLAEMTNLALPVPKGFTITTEACSNYYKENKSLNKALIDEISNKITEVEKLTKKKLNDDKNPLLLSVRSGASVSMPGMMDSILNLGMNDKVVKVMEKLTNNKFFAYDSYRRLIMMYADVVKGFAIDEFEDVLTKIKKDKKVDSETKLSGTDMENITILFKKIYKKHAKVDFPQDPFEQLKEAICAVFESWNNDRAIAYRKMNNITNCFGTAVNVQQMVYGNMGNTSGTGVAFSRNPVTGENKLYGEYLINAQGEDIVSGSRTPCDISKLKTEMPNIYDEFLMCAKKLEKHYANMQDMEFTIENKKLYILQTRNGKRTAKSAVKIAVDMYNEKLISMEDAILMVDVNSIDQLLHKTFDEEKLKSAKILTKGLPASPGAAVGKIRFNAKDINTNDEVILVRNETSAEDIEGINHANGILTVHGGKTSHAAVVARGMGKCCVSGASDIVVDYKNKTITVNDIVLHENDYISLDGSSGIVYLGKIDLVEPSISKEFKTFMSFVDKVKKLGVYVNADNATDAKKALSFGAEGIGLCRSEHMFFEENRILSMRQMIIADNELDRNKAIAKLLSYQKEDYTQIFKVMKDKPVTIRLLDPPLHEFLPKTKEDIKKLATSLSVSVSKIEKRIEELREFNPMMGHRGCRLTITYKEIAIMQARAIIESAIDVDTKIEPEIMIPLVGDVKELEYVKKVVNDTAKLVMKKKNKEIKYKIGTMIEVPRAAILSNEIAKEADFFSYGTNDLTQLTYGFSRDDSEKFLNDYYRKKILTFNPFETIDQKGVGKLMQISVHLARKVKPNIKLGICGEHGGEVKSIEFSQKLGLDYVSCSLYRIPIAKLAAAQALINKKN